MKMIINCTKWCRKVWGVGGGRMGVKTFLRIAYSNKKWSQLVYEISAEICVRICQDFGRPVFEHLL